MRVSPPGAFVDDVAAFLAGAMAEDRGGRTFTAVLAGGATPRPIYQAVPRFLPSPRDLGHVHLFWGDERDVPLGDPLSNAGAARSSLSGWRVPPANHHPMPAGAGNLDEAARAYERELRSHLPSPVFLDLVLLGLGEDGHVASLFPGDGALTESHRWVVPVHQAPKPPPDRLTLTFPILNTARILVVLASGRAKAEVVRRLWLSDEDIPARRLAPAGELIGWLDEDAASLLES